MEKNGLDDLQFVDEQSFLEILRISFLGRSEKNASYSLRAFARSLDVDPGLLSRVMNRKRRPSKAFMEKTLEYLNPDFEDLLAASTLKRESVLKAKKLGSVELKPIARWYFFLLLDLFFLPDFESDASWMADRTGLKLSVVNNSLDLLEQYGHIDRSNESWDLCSSSTMWLDLNSSSQIRKNMQKQILEKAVEAIEKVDFQYRESSSLSLPMDKALVPELKKKVTEFRREIRQWIESKENYNEVYQFSFSFFPLTEIKEKNDEK